MSEGLILIPKTHEERVQYCMQLMRENAWRTGASNETLAEQWKVHLTTMKRISAEASRRVLAEVEDRPRLRVAAILNLEKLSADSIESAATASGKERALERSNAIRVNVALLEFTRNAEAAQANWDELSNEEKHAKLDEAQARIDSMRAQLPARAELPE